MHSRTPDLTRTQTSNPVKSWGRPQLDIRLEPVPGLTRCRTRFCKSATGSHFLMNHEDTKSLRAATTVPLCLCGGTDLWQIYGGTKGVNPASMLNRVCNGLVVTKVQRPKGAVEKKNRDKLPLSAPKRAFSRCSGKNRGILE